MIAYVFLTVGVSATAVVAYAVAPAGRGVHRYVVPRATLRAEAARLNTEAEGLACHLRGLTSEVDGAYEELDATRDERDNALAALEKAALRIAELEEQLGAFADVCAENTRLRSHLDNAHAVRPLPARDDASALPDELQEFADQTAAAWRASA